MTPADLQRVALVAGSVSIALARLPHRERLLVLAAVVDHYGDDDVVLERVAAALRIHAGHKPGGES